MLKNYVSATIDRLTPIKFFLIIAGVFGMLFLLVTPPFQGADEIVHFYRAYQVSEGNFVADKHNGEVGGFMPASLGKVIAESNSSVIKFYPDHKYDEHRTKAALSIPNELQNKKFYEFAASAPYSPVPYTGASFGILTARLLHFPTLVAFYAARLGNLLAWMALIAAAIHFLPRRKWVMVAIGLLPMALFQASTLNGDAVTLGSLALFIALLLYFYDKQRLLALKEKLFLLVVTAVMVLSKQVMFIFLPLLLLLKKYHFSSRTMRYVWIGILAMLPLLFFGLWMYVTRIFDSTTAYANQQNPPVQLNFILHNPHSYVNVLWNTYFYTWGDGITRSFIGTFGWADTPLSELVVTIGYVGLALLVLGSTGDDKTPLVDKKAKGLLLTIAVLYWLAVSTSLYLYYSPLGYKIIYGLQGRYFIALLLLIFPVAWTKSVSINDYLYKKIALILPIFLLSSSIITIYVRYFIHNV